MCSHRLLDEAGKVILPLATFAGVVHPHGLIKIESVANPALTECGRVTLPEASWARVVTDDECVLYRHTTAYTPISGFHAVAKAKSSFRQLSTPYATNLRPVRVITNLKVTLLAKVAAKS